MKLTILIALSIALAVIVAPYSVAQGVGDLRSCSLETQQVLSVALQYGLGNVPEGYVIDRLDPKSPVIPDYGILRDERRIYVLNRVDEPACVIDRSVLPQSQSATFELVDDDRLTRLARRNGEAIAYVRASEVVFGENEVEIRLGAALRAAPGGDRGLACCCGGQMILRRVAGQWVFAEWRNVFCA